MCLQQVVIQGFQSYAEEQTIEIDEHVTLLAGRNNVGKSALLRALQIPVERQEGVAKDLMLTTAGRCQRRTSRCTWVRRPRWAGGCSAAEIPSP